MEWVETTGKTLEEAKEAALDQLAVDVSDAEFVIIREPKTGLFGRLRGEARVRARVRPASVRPKRTRGNGRRKEEGQRRPPANRHQDNGHGGTSTEQRTSGAEVTDSGAGGDRSDSVSAMDSAASPSKRRRSRSSGPKTQTPAGTAVTASSVDEGSAHRGAGSASAPKAPTAQRAPRPKSGTSRTRVAKEDEVGEMLTLEEQGDHAQAFLEGLVRELGISAVVSKRSIDETTLEIALDGVELGILVGPAGATLAALQELTRTVVQRRPGIPGERIVVEVAGYRAKRAEALERFTKQIVDEIRESGIERSLEPMSAADRKVVHDTVNGFEGFSTRSEGEEPRRYIVISAQ